MDGLSRQLAPTGPPEFPFYLLASTVVLNPIVKLVFPTGREGDLPGQNCRGLHHKLELSFIAEILLIGSLRTARLLCTLASLSTWSWGNVSVASPLLFVPTARHVLLCRVPSRESFACILLLSPPI